MKHFNLFDAAGLSSDLKIAYEDVIAKKSGNDFDSIA